jgi:2-keto-4-pentenoate hydratase/2-oxohepta-3-ene-1,7-dioic acid hydratase in catechol pathway
MAIIRYTHQGKTQYGQLHGQWITPLAGSPFEVHAAPAAGRQPLALADVQVLCPIDRPRLFAVGMNYKGHIAEAGARTPDKPQMFMMPCTAAVASGEAIVLPHEARLVHHEGELAIIIGKRGRRIPAERAREFILGYSCANDVSERSIQNEEMALGTLLIGKSFDTFCPLGPVIATDLEPSGLAIETRVNGQVRQAGNTADLLFSVEAIVAYLSQAITLLPGDVILTGTPSGVGPLQPGDRVEVTIEGIGTLANPVVAEA